MVIVLEGFIFNLSEALAIGGGDCGSREEVARPSVHCHLRVGSLGKDLVVSQPSLGDLKVEADFVFPQGFVALDERLDGGKESGGEGGRRKGGRGCEMREYNEMLRVGWRKGCGERGETKMNKLRRKEGRGIAESRGER